jgi:hypothetical protein
MKAYAAIMAIIVLTHSPLAQAEDEDSLEGFGFLSRENCEKGKVNAKCIMNFQIHGASAKLLYENMKGKPEHDGCQDGKVKDDGAGLLCYFTGDKKYECDFGYSFAKRKLVPSEVDC